MNNTTTGEFIDDNETWLEVHRYPMYLVSNLGRIRSLSRGRYKIITQVKSNSGYYRVLLYDENRKCKNFTVHRLVATAFLPTEDTSLTVNHKNGKKFDNRADNLEWATLKENIAHAYSHLGKKGSRTTGSRVFCENTNKTYISMAAAARDLNTNTAKIKHICDKLYRSDYPIKIKYV